VADFSALEPAQIEAFIRDFFVHADGSAPLVWYLPYIEDDFFMVWTPTCQFHGELGFEEFYRNLTGNLFDRTHVVTDVNTETDGTTAKISFKIHLTAKSWFPPLPKSISAENHAEFTWEMRMSDKTGKPVITNYFLTAIQFPEGSIVLDADKVFKYPTFMYGPWGFP